MLTLRLFMLQRVTALVMAPLVFGHLAVMIYAVRGGLSTGEILSRTQGSIPWALFYGCFVVAVSIHATIGLRVIISETLPVRGFLLNAFSWVLCAFPAFHGTARGLFGDRDMIRPHRNHPLWFAYILHRLSGLALALFLPHISTYCPWH